MIQDEFISLPDHSLFDNFRFIKLIHAIDI